MSISSANRIFQLLSRVFDVQTATEAFLPPSGQKLSMPVEPVEQPFERATPESVGIPAAHIEKFFRELAPESGLSIQQAMILRKGKLLSSVTYDGQVENSPKYTFSACKSITSLAVGLLVDDGLLALDEKIEDIFEDLKSPVFRLRLKGMTVQHLLTMEAGLLFGEADALAENDWVRGFLGSSSKSDPGEEFYYNSLNTYMLSVIVRMRSGKPMLSLLKERIFAPMGITEVLWEESPAGIEKGGWGMYIRPEDLAKLGQLVMDGGMWNGQQLISREYIEDAISVHSHPGPNSGNFEYGYQIWVNPHEHSFLFSGMLGQNVLGFLDSGVLVVTFAGMDTDEQNDRYFEIASRYFGGHFPNSLPSNASDNRSLMKTIQSFSAFSGKAQNVNRDADPFLHQTFLADDKKACSVGILPMVLQILYNNYTKGVTSIGISMRDQLPELIYREKDAVYRFPVGLGVPVVSELCFRGDTFRISAVGRFTHDEDLHPAFVIRIEFVETPCIRTIKLIRTHGGILLRQTETPGVPYVYNKLTEAAESTLYRSLISLAMGNADPDFLLFKTRQVLAPELNFRSSKESWM